MKMKNKLYGILAGAACLLSVTSCNIDPEFYTQVAPETFYTSQDAVWQRFNRSMTHWRWYMGESDARWALQELGTDEYCLPTRGTDWQDGGQYQRIHHHDFDDHMTRIHDGWKNVGMGVALAWDALEDLSQINFEALGFEPGTREQMLAQQQVVAASLLLDGLDFFGGQPLYNSTQEDLKPRSTDKETFEYIDSLLNEALLQLPVKKELGAMETGAPYAAAAAALKARLYFNAESYIGEAMYEKAATICQDIIDGKYGKYELDADWTKTFGFTNEYSNEIIWSVPSENAKTETNAGYWTWQVPYNYKNYLGGIEGSGSNNGIGLTPGLDPTGKPYTYKLGSPYRKFHDSDIRKQPYVYLGDGKHQGMFIVGEMVNPLNPEWTCTGSREYAGEVLTIVDQVGYFAKVGKADKETGEVKYPTKESLPSTIAHAEENSCVRLMKRCPRPDVNDQKKKGNPDTPVIRLAEMYYILAECKYRSGDADGAAQLINTVRARYFEGADPDPVTAANLDKYRLLDEWMIEFLGEGRRRTDLVRWDAYVTEDWWDHKATNNPNLNRFPVYYSILGSNSLLEQNPGY